MEKIIKKQGGISLVALIVTIIVMVILAGIIIVSAVADGGVIDRAKLAMQEQERADVQEIIISSYIYDATATTGNTYAFIDLEKTAGAIFDNLTSNGFEIVGADEVSDFYTPGDTEIDLEVKGDHGIYEGTVDKEGLTGDLITKPEEDDDEDEEDEEDDIIIGEEETDLTKLKKYFATAPILKYTVGNNGPVFDDSILLNVELDENFNPITIEFKGNNVLTEDEAKSIVFDYTVLMGELENGPLDLSIEYNGENYIVKSNVNINETDMILNITATDVVLYEIPQGEIDELNKYFFEMPEEGSGETPTGKATYGNLWNGDVTFNDDSNTELKEDELLKLGELNLSSAEYLYFRYNAKVYKVKLNTSDFSTVWNTENNTGVELEYQPTGDSKLGKYVKYDDKLWIVLYDDGELGSNQGAQLISADTLEIQNITLGYNDSIVDWNNVNHDYIVDGSSIIEEDEEKAIYSYNNAIDSLNRKSISLVNDKSKIALDENGEYIIRSVGSDPIDRNKEELYGDENFYTTLNDYESYNDDSLKGLIKNSDNNYQKDIERMNTLGIKITDNKIGSAKISYWLASRSSISTSSNIKCNIRRIDYQVGLAYETETHIGNITTTGFSKVNDYLTQGIRPVITLKPGSINNVSGTGTISDPYILK